ncbi:ABC transporter ATP-binding protein [Vagococcus acidifermentans]|uniref:ABC transporter domain-containing protein n=1 Tax=Vagococcus acidifermentans TaxID=564710 RepID=A0A430B152_9ENTE|nr:ATP-binding cassette domain-containing protein [Vagococcus acidifermentans]RSU13981.1 hypothetical protein CBF27_03340 [Vagococcus acidifermentans]
MTRSYLLEAKQLSKTFTLQKKFFFGGQRDVLKAVNHVSLGVYEGETLGIVGESGCGKSTLARLLTCLIKPTAGRVLFKGEDITNFTKEQLTAVRRDIQMIFQDPYASLDPRKRVFQLLAEPLAIHHIGTKSEREQMVFDVLEQVGLQKAHAARYPHEFSGGQCQRLNIARALILQPKIIICDEPVSALDVSIQAQILNLLLDLQQTNHLTYLFISHDLNVVRYFCDRIAVMNMGEVVESGPSDEVYGAPKDQYTRKLLAAIPKPIYE